MSAIAMVFFILLVLSSITLLSRQRRLSRQRKLEAVLAKVKQTTDQV